MLKEADGRPLLRPARAAAVGFELGVALHLAAGEEHAAVPGRRWSHLGRRGLCPLASDENLPVAQGPIAELPDEVTLTRDELAILLFALDVVE